MFYIIAGAINLRIHNSSLILATGAMFMVPRGASLTRICFDSWLIVSIRKYLFY